MPMPSVTTSVVDLTARVSSVGTYNSAIVVAAKKGPIDVPTLVTSQTAFLERFTPDETLEIGWDTALYEAYIYLAQNSNLYVVRAANTTSKTAPVLYGGCHIRVYNSTEENEPIDAGFKVVQRHANDESDFTKGFHLDIEDGVMDFENDAMIIYGSSQGKWNDNIAVTIITDPSIVKLEGAFVIRVYKNKVLVETHTCSLDPSLKNGFGVNCYVEDVLKASKYIRADVNDDTDLLKHVNYCLQVVGKVIFKNEIVERVKQAIIDSEDLSIKPIHRYNSGDIVKVSQIDNVYGYYKCTTAGRTANEGSEPDYTQDGEYKEVVTDGDAVFTLQEVLKPHETGSEYKKSDIVIVTEGSKTYYYRALVNGVTDIEKPEYNDEYTVEDGTVTFANTYQEEIVYEPSKDSKGEYLDNAYTEIKKQKGSKINPMTTKVYGDEYLAKVLVLDPTVEIENPTTVDHAMEELEVTYVATYSGNVTASHYCLPKASSDYVSLFGGSDGVEVVDADRIRALKKLKNRNDVNIQLIMDGGNTTPAYQRAIDEVCEFREDSCHGIISTPYMNEMGMVSGDAQQDVVNYRNYTLNANTRRLELYTTHQMVYDEFNDRNIYVSPSCFVASRIMSVVRELGWHWAVAGYNRGVINSLDVANTFDPSEVDTFSDAQINTIIKEPGLGNVIFDELTLLSKACDLQDAHISRYVDIYLRPRLKEALKYYLFEFNDEITRTLITKMIETFMEPEKSARACYDYKVVCDETNNTASDIENNILNCWLFLKPTKIAKWIKQKIILTPYGTDFDEIQF